MLNSAANSLRALECLVERGEAGVSEIARHLDVTVGHRVIASWSRWWRWVSPSRTPTRGATGRAARSCPSPTRCAVGSTCAIACTSTSSS